MAIIKDIEQVKPLLAVGKTLQNIQKVGEVNDGWARFERILTGVDQLFSRIVDYRDKERQSLNPEVKDRQILTDDGIGSRREIVQDAPVKPVSQEQSELNKKQVELQSQFVQFVTGHINACAKENPNMTFGEAIMKLPVNVTQLSVLLQLNKKDGEK